MKTLVPALLASLLLCPSALFAKDTPMEAALPVDDRIEVRETLPNGMELWIRRHDLPKDKVSMALLVDAGSIFEKDDQRGLAHYIEHMAFNGSTNFPPDTLVKTFEAMGVQFGRDQNAFTSFDRVAYTLNLPNTDPKNIGTGLQFFSDVASGLLFTPAELDKERGVILEELRSRDDSNDRLRKRMIKVLAPGSLISERMVGGVESVIEAAKRPQFVDYYQRWYRSDLATVMIVGDVDPAAIAKSAREAFADWPKSEQALAMPDSGLATLPTLTASIFTDPDLTTAECSLTQVLPTRMMKTKADLRASMVERLAAYIGRDRLTARQQAGDAPWQEAQMMVVPFVTGVRLSIASCESELKHWDASQNALYEEIQRIRVHGVTDDELAKAKQVFLTGAETRVASDGQTPSGGIINGWLRRTRGNHPMSAKQGLALMQEILPGVTALEVHEQFKALFNLTQGAIIMTLPESHELPATSDLLKDMATKSSQAEVAAPTAEEQMSALLEKAPTPGTIVSESMHHELMTTELVLSNGAIVYIRPMPTAKVVSISANFYGGIIDETAENRGISSLVGRAMGGPRAATQRHTSRQISEYLNDKKAGVSLSRGDVSFTASIGGPPGDDLKDACELIHVLLTEPKITPVSFDAAKRELVTALEQAVKETGNQVMLKIRSLLAPNEIRVGLPTIESINKITIEQAQSWLEKLLAQSPLEIVVTGNISVEDAKALILPYLGSLAKRDDGRASFRARRTLQAGSGPAMETIEVDTASSAAIVFAGWQGVPLGNPRLRASLIHAGQILRGRMHEEIREKRGLTYSAMAGYQSNSYDGLDMLIVQFTADPKSAESTAKIARDVAEEFRDKGPTDQEVANTAMMLNAGLSSGMQNPQFWTQFLSGASLDPAGLSSVHALLGYLRTVEGPRVHAAAKLVMRDDRFFQVIGVPKAAPAKDGEADDTEDGDTDDGGKDDEGTDDEN